MCTLQRWAKEYKKKHTNAKRCPQPPSRRRATRWCFNFRVQEQANEQPEGAANDHGDKSLVDIVPAKPSVTVEPSIGVKKSKPATNAEQKADDHKTRFIR